MRTNKFSIGGLRGVYFSSIVNQNNFIRTILNIFFFFYKKNLITQKCKSNQNQLTKQKQVKQQRQQFLLHKSFWEGENCLFCIFFYLKSLLKKNWNCPDNLIYSTTKSLKIVHFDWSIACKVYNFWPKKVQTSYL